MFLPLTNNREFLYFSAEMRKIGMKDDFWLICINYNIISTQRQTFRDLVGVCRNQKVLVN